MEILRYLSSDNPEIQSASQHTQAWEFLDLYHLILICQSIFTGIGNITSLLSDNPEIQFASQYTQAWKFLDLYHLTIQKSNNLICHSTMIEH